MTDETASSAETRKPNMLDGNAHARAADPLIAQLERGELVAAALGIQDTLDAMGRGDLQDTMVERAFLTGALSVLQTVIAAETARSS